MFRRRHMHSSECCHHLCFCIFFMLCRGYYHKYNSLNNSNNHPYNHHHHSSHHQYHPEWARGDGTDNDRATRRPVPQRLQRQQQRSIPSHAEQHDRHGKIRFKQVILFGTIHYFLAGLQSNSGLWIDDFRLSVCLFVRPSVCQHLVNLCV